MSRTVLALAARTTLAQRALARWARAGWILAEAYHAHRTDTLTVETGDRISSWANLGTAGGAMVQATDTKRPTLEATGLNSKPALSFDGGDHMGGPSFDASGYTAAIVSILLTDSITGNAILIERSTNFNSSDGGYVMDVNDAAAGDASMVGRTPSGYTKALAAAAAAPLTSASVLSGSWDRALATNETEIYLDGSSITNTRPLNVNMSTAGFGTYSHYLGDRSGGGVLPITGKIAAVHIAFGSTAVPTSTLAADIADMRQEWGL